MNFAEAASTIACCESVSSCLVVRRKGTPQCISVGAKQDRGVLVGEREHHVKFLQGAGDPATEVFESIATLGYAQILSDHPL